MPKCLFLLFVIHLLFSKPHCKYWVIHSTEILGMFIITAVLTGDLTLLEQEIQ